MAADNNINAYVVVHKRSPLWPSRQRSLPLSLSRLRRVSSGWTAASRAVLSAGEGRVPCPHLCDYFFAKQCYSNINYRACYGQGGEMSIRILIADDHAVVRQGLQMFLGFEDDFEVVGEAANGKQAVELAHKYLPDVVLMDLLMPEMNGIAATEAIRQALPDTEVIALTSVLEDASVVGAIRAGAIGYLLKDTDSAELIRAIKAAAAGQVQLSPKAAARLMREVRAPESPESLTERETEVLRLIAAGLSNREIAQRLVIGEKTVKTHVSSILSKLGVTSRTQAALYAARIGLANGLGAE